MYKVINLFTDIQDNGYLYNVGDEYPRKGYKPTAERVRGVLGNNNGRGKPMIVEVEEVETAEKTPKKVETAEMTAEVPEKAKKPRKKTAKKTK